MPSLAEVQQLMRDAVVKGDANGMAALVAGGGDAGRRLAIHQRHYRASLVAALMGRYKATAWLMGSEAVERAAATFIREHPPVAPCIAEYGEAFPEYLSRHVTTNRAPYLAAFATLDWHLGRLAVAVDRPAVARAVWAALPPAGLVDLTVTCQPGLYYFTADRPIDELMRLYLTDAAPDRLALAETRAWVEVRGNRGSLTFARLSAGEFAFRKAAHTSAPLGRAVEQAFAADDRFDPSAALANLIDAHLVTDLDVAPGARHS